MSRHLAAAAAAAAALCAGAGPALAHTTASATSALRAKTPLVTTITAQTPLIADPFQLSNDGVDGGLHDNAIATDTAALTVTRVHADSAQLSAKLEWTLGAYLQEAGDNTVHHGETLLVYGHSTSGHAAIHAGLADFRLSNYYIGHADSLLGVPHPVYSARPNAPYRNGPPVDKTLATAAIRTPRSLTAAIAMGTPVLQETVPDDVETTSVRLNEAACDYYSLLFARMGTDRAQRTAQLEWLGGVRAQLRGDELLARGIETHTVANPATGNREMRDALVALRRSDSVIAHADASLHVHLSGPSVRLPAHPVYYKG